MNFILKPGQLNFSDIKQCAKEKKKCQLDKASIAKIQASGATVQAVLAHKKTVYGINTGFGALANQQISEDDLAQLQRNIVLSHACGTGELLTDETVALILLLKINRLAQGY